ncbi:MAG TPA: hypothetical protein VK923_02455 [Euzebyales bacterium]|nr:hypothetical protein [Euzebyales bacterium]
MLWARILPVLGLAPHASRQITRMRRWAAAANVTGHVAMPAVTATSVNKRRLDIALRRPGVVLIRPPFPTLGMF